MDIQSVVEQLREEIRLIENVINALLGLGSVSAPRRGRPPKSASARAGQKRTMSPAARARISAAMKQRWAKQKKASAAPKKAASLAKKATVRRPMSPAAKKKLSRLMKARWAARKKTA